MILQEQQQHSSATCHLILMASSNCQDHQWLDHQSSPTTTTNISVNNTSIHNRDSLSATRPAIKKSTWRMSPLYWQHIFNASDINIRQSLKWTTDKGDIRREEDLPPIKTTTRIIRARLATTIIMDTAINPPRVAVVAIGIPQQWSQGMTVARPWARHQHRAPRRPDHNWTRRTIPDVEYQYATRILWQ